MFDEVMAEQAVEGGVLEGQDAGVGPHHPAGRRGLAGQVNRLLRDVQSHGIVTLLRQEGEEGASPAAHLQDAGAGKGLEQGVEQLCLDEEVAF